MAADRQSARKIAFLHTAFSNIGLFEAAVERGAASCDWTLQHAVQPELLAAVSGAAGDHEDVYQETRRQLRLLAIQADAVVLTCSSLGPACENWSDAPEGLFRADEALAWSSMAIGGRVLALYAAPSSEAPTRALFQAAAKRSSADVACRQADGAWPHFLAGRQDDYADAIAHAVRMAGSKFDVVALAQTSMAVAVNRLGPSPTVRTVPDAVVERLHRLWPTPIA